MTTGGAETAFEAPTLGGWTREWGLVVSEGDPAGIEGLDDLVDGDLAFVNRDRASGLRTALDDRLAALADDRGTPVADLERAIEGWGRATKAHESPARAVAEGTADAGLGLRASATALGLGFVPLGEQAVRVLANSERVEKPGVRAFAEALERLEDLVDDLDGYGPLADDGGRR